MVVKIKQDSKEDIIVGNIELKKDNDFSTVSIETNIFGLPIIYSAAYAMQDRAHIFLSGDSEGIVNVEIRAKEEKQDLLELSLEFNNSLINYAYYKEQSENTKELRKEIVNKSMAPLSVRDSCDCSEQTDEETEELDFDESDFEDLEFDDPDDIAVPWEEKYGQETDQGAVSENNPAESVVQEETEELDFEEDIEIPWEDEELEEETESQKEDSDNGEDTSKNEEKEK